MFASLKLKLAVLANQFSRRNGPSTRDQCAQLIMHTCSLQLERSEARELAPTEGATGPMSLSGGAITTVTYNVFDPDADQVDASIKKEPWRAFARVVMRLTIEKDPEFEVQILSKADPDAPDGFWAQVEPRSRHKAPGLALIKHLSQYFPLIARPHRGPTIKPAGDLS